MKKGDIWKDGGEMEDYQAMSKFANENGLMFARNADGDFEIMEFPEYIETPEETQARYTQVAQSALDTFARTRGYDSIMSACSYATSTDAQFRAEAECCVTLRDATWRRAYEILDAVIAGTMELPTEEEFLTMLPVADAHWQDEQTAEPEQENGDEIPA